MSNEAVKNYAIIQGKVPDSGALLSQLEMRSRLAAALDLVGTPVCWSTHHTSACPSAPHRHLLWRDGGQLLQTLVYDSWQRQVGYKLRRSQWQQRCRELEALVALHLIESGHHLPSELRERRLEEHLETIVSLDAFQLTLRSRFVSFLLQFDQARTQYEQDRAQYSCEPNELEQARLLLERLTACGFQLVHPALPLLAIFPRFSGLLYSNHRVAWHQQRGLWTFDWSDEWRIDENDLFSEADVDALLALAPAQTFFWLMPLALARQLAQEEQQCIGRLVEAQALPLRLALAEQVYQLYLDALFRLARRRSVELGLLDQKHAQQALTFADLPSPEQVAAVLQQEQTRWAPLRARLHKLHHLLQPELPSPAHLSVGLFLLDGLPLSPTRFWQLPERSLFDGSSGKIRGKPLAQVRLHESACPGWEHIHVLWEEEQQLYRMLVPLQPDRYPDFRQQRGRFVTTLTHLRDFYALQRAPDALFRVMDANGEDTAQREVLLDGQVFPLSSAVFQHLRLLRHFVQRAQARQIWTTLPFPDEAGLLEALLTPLTSWKELAAAFELRQPPHIDRDREEEEPDEGEGPFFDEEDEDEFEEAQDYLSGAADQLRRQLVRQQRMLRTRARMLSSSPVLRPTKRFLTLSAEAVLQRVHTTEERLLAWEAQWQRSLQRLSRLPQVFVFEEEKPPEALPILNQATPVAGEMGEPPRGKWKPFQGLLGLGRKRQKP